MMTGPESLAQYLEERRTCEFSFGTFDCALFAADWVHRLTGIDHAAELRGYASQLDAYRIVASFGSMEKMVSSALGREPVPPAFAMRGDIVLATLNTAEGEGRDTIGICEGARCFFPRHPRGLVAMSRGIARLAWRIE